jgi:hypothetical protein
MKKDYIIASILLTITIACVVLMVVFVDRDYIHNVKNKNDCEDKSKLPDSCKNDKNCCGIWNDGYCRKGTIKGDSCNSKGDNIPLVFLVVSILCFIAFVFFLIRGLRT